MSEMPKFIDLTGQAFGLWTVLSRAANSRHNRTMWACRCGGCGNVYIIDGGGLRTGGSKSCQSCSRIIDLKGMRFGRLLVIEYGHTKKKRTFWHCRCDCGKEKDIRGDQLKAGHTKSCGCLHGVLASGENHYNWNPALTFEDRLKSRSFPEYYAWRIGVLDRDKYTCQACGKRGGKLESHHLFGHADYPHLALELSNGVTLCKCCHLNFHKDFGFGGNTPEQFENFRHGMA